MRLMVFHLGNAFNCGKSKSLHRSQLTNFVDLSLCIFMFTFPLTDPIVLESIQGRTRYVTRNIMDLFDYYIHHYNIKKKKYY